MISWLGFCVQPEMIITPASISAPRMPMWALAGMALTATAVAAIAAVTWTDAPRIRSPCP
jgi:hypothetical protein